ncbi:hypothetical protein BIY37_08860 [Candidatus Brocadia sapporoensis]|uniref:Uncharacterized protein n=1 Tax=Candidatus Brocadia sapporoensis TaxID=392547 RepID=A0A1V6LZ19_9BACT|nr:hypothetical protein BIY37_08860 [Candidatus Brocadia sapporoensis]TVL97802.1 MAG: hypothetical protein CV082_02825 [Candidatus Brocadia sp. BL1]
MEKPFANLLNFSPSPFLLRIFNGKILTQILKQVKYFHNAAKLQPKPPINGKKEGAKKPAKKLCHGNTTTCVRCKIILPSSLLHQ